MATLMPRERVMIEKDLLYFAIWGLIILATAGLALLLTPWFPFR